MEGSPGHLIQVGGLYRHYKGGIYRVLGIARQSETGEWLVIYQDLSEQPRPIEPALWARPLPMFVERVVADGAERPRFEYIADWPQ